MILLLQILGVLAALIVAFWMLGVFLSQVVNGGVSLANLLLGIVALALAIWQPLAYGWIVV